VGQLDAPNQTVTMKLLLVCCLAAAPALMAHVGSPDIFYQGDAGPYRLLITIRPPQVVPGVAEIEIRSLSADVRQIHVVPLRLAITGGQFPPVPDLARPSKEDPQFYTGSLWLMVTGSWQVRVDVDGARGPATLSIPVPALSTRILGMQRAIAVVLLPLGLLLAIGAVSIAGACIREAPLDPGAVPDGSRVRSARFVMAAVAVFVVGAVWLGNKWWDSEQGDYQRIVFKPLQLQAGVENGNRLAIQLVDTGWMRRSTEDLLPDHGHLMHLYVFRMAEMDLVWHLHPERTGGAAFTQQLPSMPAGRYALFADVVHANGLAETAITQIQLPEIHGVPLTGDDAAGSGPPISKADYNRNVTPFNGGYQMVWDRPQSLRARQPYLLQFHLEDAGGKPAGGMELYMGMLGHAAFVRSDLSVFAHVHPSGSAPMPALELTGAVSPHQGHMLMQSGIPAEVSFPYGFPKSGNYRIYVQMKRAGEVVTGVFDAQVEN
jgi:hypothetical protein